MKKVLYVRKRVLFLFSVCFMFLVVCPYIILAVVPAQPTSIYEDPGNGIIVIDPGHGGIDSGAVKNNIEEKDINLDTALKLKELLVQNGYKVIMTREEDVALEPQGNGSSRHRRDLDARVGIINNSNAQFFVSIHTNLNPNKPSTNGSIVFYNRMYDQNVFLAYNIQRALNGVSMGGVQRTAHNPVIEKYYLLDHAKIPGVLVEIGFLSNTKERQQLNSEDFRDLLAQAILSGIDSYLGKSVYNKFEN